MNVKPLGDRVIVKGIETAKVSEGGLIIPEDAQEKSVRATVVAVGTGNDLGVNVGDIVIHGKYSGTEIKVEGESYLILNINDVYTKEEE